MKKTGLVILILILLGAGFYKWKTTAKKTHKKSEGTSVVVVSRGSIERTVDATGEVTPLNRVEIKPPISGRVESLLVDEGSLVKAGQILAWMSSSDRAAILDAALAKGPEELKRWQDAYNPTPIIAPLSGTIILRNVVVGQTVDGTTVLFAMSDKLMVLAQVDEADISHVSLGMRARVTLDAYPDQPIYGKVSQVLYEGKNVSSVITYGVKVSPDKAPPFFRSQMTANVSLILDQRDNAIVIPSQAIRENSDGKSVQMPGPEGKPVSRPIQTGIEAGEKVEVLSGLDEGDKILISRSKYTPQKDVQSSPLTMGGPKPAGSGKNGGSGGSSSRRGPN